MRKTIVLVIALFAVLDVLSAQKIGHMNLGNLLAEMPEAGRADSTLVLYQKQESMTGDSLAVIFENEYKVFEEAYRAGTLSQQQSQKRQEELEKKRQQIVGYMQSVKDKVEILRQQLLQPILAKIEDAIKLVGKEEGFDAIFDMSTGQLLFAQESQDITPLVKKKLGMK